VVVAFGRHTLLPLDEIAAAPSSASRPPLLRWTIPSVGSARLMDLKKEKNFFETRVIEYQNGGSLTWD